VERVINLHVERLPDGVYLATSDDVQGLLAQGRTIVETLEIARDVATKLLEEQRPIDEPAASVIELIDIPLVIGL
jgi:predicted RNase H-like HicB family nuclease